MQLTRVVFISLISLCYILFVPKGYGQNKIRVLDSQTNTPVPFASVYNKQKQFGYYVNEYGELLIPDQISVNDTLVISNVGYETQKIIVSEIKSEIHLKSKTQTLNEVTITPKGREISLGSKKEHTHFIESINRSNLRNEIALLIKNEQRYRGKIMSISFYISPYGKPKAPFKLRLYRVEGTKPKEDLLNESIIVHAGSKGGWTTINLEKHNLNMNDNGIFISMESIYGLKLNFYYNSRNMSTGKIERNYGQSLGLTDEFDSAISYQRQFNGEWMPFERKFPSYLSKKTFYPMMKIKIKLDE